jgi:aryl-phospho-beta-D-glucosidase BglC (GH1 family)
MTIHVDGNSIVGPVPALRGIYVGDSPEPIQEEDIARLKEDLGLTCIRHGFEAVWLSDEEREVYHEEGFRRLQDMLDWCGRYDIHCIMDLHNALGRLGGGDSRLWKQTYFQDRFVRLWEEIVRRFQDHPAVAAWELINEPEPPDEDFAVWNRLYQRTVDTIRRIDPYHTIIVDSIGYARPQNLRGLAKSADDNIVYSFHNYQPGPYHCQKRRELADQSTYYYPGHIPHRRPRRGQALDFDLAHYEPSEAQFWNRSELAQEMEDAIAFRDRYDVPIFCGEFGCVSDVPEMTDAVYLMDEISFFHEQGFHWTLYNTMFRTSDPYWQTHFDCGLYIYFSPEQKLHRFERKIALLRFFCATEGDVLRLDPPEDEWIGVCGVRRPDRSLALLLSNKDRHQSKEVALQIGTLPQSWAATLRTMGRGDEGFIYRGSVGLENGLLRLHLSPLTLALVTVPAPPHQTWAFDRVEGQAG